MHRDAVRVDDAAFEGGADLADGASNPQRHGRAQSALQNTSSMDHSFDPIDPTRRGGA